MITIFQKVLSSVFLLLLMLRVGAQDSDFHIYLCFGQSNMNGKGAIETQDKIVDERFKVFQAMDCSDSGRIKAKWYTATPPLSKCNSGLSPADYFGRTMVDSLPENIKIGIINVSVQGSDIRLFDKDIYTEFYQPDRDWFMNIVKGYEMNPYRYFVDLAKLAQHDGVIKGILLHQGETNAGQKQWLSYVNKIYRDLLTDLSLSAEIVPLLAGELVSVEENCCAEMNSIINRLPDTIPTAHIISSKGCTAMDKAHFNSEGYRELGRRYAYKMLSILELD